MVCGDTELHRVLNHPQESSWLALGGSSGKKGREEGNQSHGVGNVCCVLCLVSQSCLTLCDSMDHSPPGTSVHRDSLGENTGVGCHALLQGIFPTRDRTHVSYISCVGRQVLYHLGSPCYLVPGKCSWRVAICS